MATNLQITAQSQWMKNQKHADVMAPDNAFQVIQTQDGDSVFFSIGTDYIFWVTREIPGDNINAGWNRENLIANVSEELFANKSVTAKTFSVAQDAETKAFDLALVVTVDTKADYLLISYGNLNTDDSWGEGVKWAIVDYDGASGAGTLSISDVYLMNTPIGDNNAPVVTCFADIEQSPGVLARYLIEPGQTPSWIPHTQADNFTTLYSCLGKRTRDNFAGIYTLGKIQDEIEILYQVLTTGNTAPVAVNLNPPDGASAIATSLDCDGNSCLFVSGSDGLSVFPPTAQNYNADAAQVFGGSTTAGASQLTAASAGGYTSVWGINTQGSLFYTWCVVGDEGTPGSWQAPVVLLQDIERYAFFMNSSLGNQVLFAHVSGQNIMQLTQDAVTKIWIQRSIMLPPTPDNDMVEFNSFTTRIEVIGSDGVPTPSVELNIYSTTSPISVFVNDVYHVLSTSSPLQAMSDGAGAVTIVQQGEALSAAVQYTVALASDASVTLSINPASRALCKLSETTQQSDLQVNVYRSDGTNNPLVPTGIDTSSAIQAITSMNKIMTEVPQDGSLTPASSDHSSHPTRSQSKATESFTLYLDTKSKGRIHYQEGQGNRLTENQRTAQDEAAGSNSSQITPASDLGEPVVLLVGDFFYKLWSAADTALTLEFEKIEQGIWNLTCTIGEIVYQATIKCLAAIAQGFEFVLSQIEIALEDLVAWLGSLFQWGEIMSTHAVLKNLLLLYADSAMSGISSLQSSIDTTITKVEASVSTWAGIPENNSDTLGTSAGGANSGNSNSTTSPQSQWALQHVKNNLTNGSSTYSVSSDWSGLEAALQTLEDKLTTEVTTDITTAFDDIKTQVLPNIRTETPEGLVKQLVGIVTNTVLTAVQDVMDGIFQVAETIGSLLVNMLKQPLDIPILSTMYSDITAFLGERSQLSFLDLMCLVVAIPTTLMYEAATSVTSATGKGVTPFPVGAQTTNDLINAKDLATFVGILSPPSTMPRSLRLTSSGEFVSSTADSSESIYNGFLMASQFVGVASSWISMFMTDIQAAVALVGGETKQWVQTVAIPAALVSYTPGIVAAFVNPGQWQVVANDILTGLSMAKAVVGATGKLSNASSSLIDIGLNLVWLAVPIEGLILQHAEPSDYFGMASGVGVNIATIAAAIALMDKEPDPDILIGANVVELLSGLLQLVYGGLLIGGK